MITGTANRFFKISCGSESLQMNVLSALISNPMKEDAAFKINLNPTKIPVRFREFLQGVGTPEEREHLQMYKKSSKEFSMSSSSVQSLPVCGIHRICPLVRIEEVLQ